MTSYILAEAIHLGPSSNCVLFGKQDRYGWTRMAVQSGFGGVGWSKDGSNIYNEDPEKLFESVLSEKVVELDGWKYSLISTEEANIILFQT